MSDINICILYTGPKKSPRNDFEITIFCLRVNSKPSRRVKTAKNTR